jgi:hypothetical protein
MVEPPRDFRAKTLARLEDEAKRNRLRRWGWSLSPRSNVFAGVAVSALAVGLLFTRTQFSGAPANGVNPNFALHERSMKIQDEPEIAISGGADKTYKTGDEIALKLTLQPSADLNNAKMLITGMSDGLICETPNATTDRGQLLWSGSVAAGSAASVKLKLHAIQPSLQYVLLHVEGDWQNYQRKIFIPVYSSEPPAQAPRLSGNWSTSESLKQIANQFGVIVATDLSHQRLAPTDLRLTTPGRCIEEVATKRGMRWTLRNGVYNVYSNDVPKSVK